MQYLVLVDASDEGKERHCDSLIMCIVTTLNEGLRNGGGIGDVLRKPSSMVTAIHDSLSCVVLAVSHCDVSTLWLTYDPQFVGKVSEMGQPTRPTQPSIPSWLVNE